MSPKINTEAVARKGAAEIHIVRRVEQTLHTRSLLKGPLSIQSNPSYFTEALLLIILHVTSNI